MAEHPYIVIMAEALGDNPRTTVEISIRQLTAVRIGILYGLLERNLGASIEAVREQISEPDALAEFETWIQIGKNTPPNPQIDRLAVQEFGRYPSTE